MNFLLPRSSSIRACRRCVSLHWPVIFTRGARYQAFDVGFDQDELQKARAWRKTFTDSHLPTGQTSFARSSGPGGQHVNKYVLYTLYT